MLSQRFGLESSKVGGDKVGRRKENIHVKNDKVGRNTHIYS